MAKREPKHVKALIKKHEKPPDQPKPKRQFIPESTLWNRLRLRKQK